MDAQERNIERRRQRAATVSTLSDTHPLWVELKTILGEGERAAIDALANPGMDSGQRAFYSGILSHINELRSAIEELRKGN